MSLESLPPIEPVELTLQNIEEKCYSRRGSEEKTVVLGPVADEGGSPEVDLVPDLLRLDKTAEVWIPVTHGSSLR